MLPLVAAGLAAGASLLGGHNANKANREESARNRAFQERMSSTSWQRGVADMRAAGLNPALAYSAGGASSPGGSTMGQSDIVGPAVSSAMGAIRMKKELQVMDETANKLYNDARLAANQTAESAYRRELLGFQQTYQRLQNRLLELQIPWATAQSRAAAKYGKYVSPLSLISRAGGAPMIGAVSGLIR